MALTKDKKQSVIEEVGSILKDSKITVLAKYDGVSVKAIQELRKNAKESNTSVKVIKNNLFKLAVSKNDKLKNVDTDLVEGQILYGFNSDDEVAPAQVFSNFAKTGQKIELIGAFTSDGNVISAEDIKAMANLPTKEQLRGHLVGVLSAPLTGFVGVVSGNLRSFINVVNARSESI